MSTGISMSSVNKIKELANNGDYSLALDILEHQDLSKSLSPQFIRICGEVYYENGLYTEARATLVRAHSMAPAGNKIIYSLIKLYLSMGFRQLAEHYFEIYKFNQEKKDAGTYRIEYMIAKAYHKPVNELYSILVSANDMETSEIWDYEMLLLHAYIRNKSKFESAAAEFRARYRNSSRLSTLEDLISDKVDLESKVYVFPCEDKRDDAPDQEAAREQEKNILEEDDLKMHPKDAKIMIMVEDDTPVTSAMKFKQMWIRSKDKKEQKRELRLEESESSDKKDKKKSRGLWGIMSKKEEELVDQEMQEIQSEKVDKEKLLDEVVFDASGDSGDVKISETEAVESTVLNDTGADVDQDMIKESTEQMQEDVATNDNQDNQDDQDDSFVIEEEPEDVVMVDADFLSNSESESDTDDTLDLQDKEIEETFDPEFADEDTSFLAEDDYVNSDEILIKNESFDSDIYLAEELNESSEESATSEEGESLEESVASEDGESLEESTVSEDGESLEESAASEDGESLEESAASEDGETPEENKSGNDSEELDDVDKKDQQENEEKSGIFDFDKAFESLEEFDIDEDGNADFDIEVQADMLFDEDTPELGVENTQENVSHPEADIKDNDDISEIGSSLEDIDNISETGSSLEDIDDISEIGSSLENFDDIFDVNDNEDVIDVDNLDDINDTDDTNEDNIQVNVISADDNESDEIKDVLDEHQRENTKRADFPVFKSSLFPDYNTEGAKMYDVKENKIAHHIETEERKISENLQKEEDLIGETDRLLARLGIKLETEFKSILDFDDTDEADEKDVDNADHDDNIMFADRDVGNEESSTDADSEDKTDNTEKVKAERESKKKKKSFKLKG